MSRIQSAFPTATHLPLARTARSQDTARISAPARAHTRPPPRSARVAAGPPGALSRTTLLSVY